MSMDTRFFLDLEGTVIDNWSSPDLVNIDRVRNFLKRQNASKVDIFSFAIWSKHDQDVFREKLKTPLENVLDVKIQQFPSVEDMRAVDQGVTSTWFDSAVEFMQIRGKQNAFILWVNANFPNCHCILVDDIVQDITLHNRLTGRNTHFINVANMEKFDV